MQDELNRVSAKLDEVTRERDHWKKQAEEFEDELFLAREALARSFK
jgi:hypothetical protein